MNLEKLIICVDREVKMRKRVYPRQVENKKMSQFNAEYEIKTMEDVSKLLKGLYTPAQMSIGYDIRPTDSQR